MSGPAMGGAPGRAAQMRPILVGWTLDHPDDRQKGVCEPQEGESFPRVLDRENEIRGMFSTWLRWCPAFSAGSSWHLGVPE